jgi:hypothetical protein
VDAAVFGTLARSACKPLILLSHGKKQNPKRKILRVFVYLIGYLTLRITVEDWIAMSLTESTKRFFGWFTPDRILALVAIAAGLVAIYYETELHNSVAEIIGALPTRYVSRFPVNLEDASRVISDAKRDDDVLVLTDILGYGYYSCPPKFNDYLAAVKHANDEKAHVQILLYGKTAALRVLNTQFTFDDYNRLVTDSDKYKNTTEPAPCQTDDLELKKKRLWYFVNTYSLKPPAPTREGYEQFQRELYQTQKRFCHQLDGVAKIRAIKEGSEVTSNEPNVVQFFWMRKGKEMVFAYPNIGIGKGFTFKSSDHSLLDVFADHFKKLWDDAGKDDAGNDVDSLDCEFFTPPSPTTPGPTK